MYPCLSSDDHPLLHSCLGTGMRFRNVKTSFVGSFGVLDRFLLLLVCWCEQYHGTATSGTDYSDLRNGDNFCSVYVGKHVGVSRYSRFCARH